jgi:hypothetical protein
MATVNPTVSDISGDGSVRKIVWAPLTTTNADGASAEWIQWADRCIQFHGTFGAGGTVKLQGSNDGTNWYDLADPQGNAISKTAAGIEQILEMTQFVRPFVSAGDGTTSITATLVMRRNNPMRT